MTTARNAASRQALASIDALHQADPAMLNDETRSLYRVMKVRKALYYSILYPFGLMARTLHPAAALLTAMAALVGFAIAILFTGGPAWLLALLGYWAAGGITYHVFSLVMTGALDKAAASVGLEGSDVLSSWIQQG